VGRWLLPRHLRRFRPHQDRPLLRQEAVTPSIAIQTEALHTYMQGFFVPDSKKVGNFFG
jgi:hypothetical protein